MNPRFDWKRGLAAVTVLMMALCGAAAAEDGPPNDDLLEVLLENGSITEEQYERLSNPQAVSEEVSVEETADSTEVDAEADEPDDDVDSVASERIAEAVNKILIEDFPVLVSYGSKGFRLETRDGNWETNLQWRFQFRLTHPYQGNPRQISQFEAPGETSFQVRRARMKIGGHGYRPWLKYYFELDLMPLRDEDDSPATASTRMIDWRVTIEKWEVFQVRVGQWKIDYNRERVDSSGRQEFVERSIINRIFTIDRQMGVQARGRLFKGKPLADFNYYVGAFNGAGRGVINDDNNLMYVGRLQWNPMGRAIKLRQTDVERTPKPTASLSAAASTVIGRCTRFSSSGCGNLDGFLSPAVAANGQYRLDQAQQGFAFRWQGFSIQQEYHWKRVTDRVNNFRTSLFGTYAQTGYFFHGLWNKIPYPLEFAFRYAWLTEPNATAIAAFNTSIQNVRQEFTVVANWFFAGHNNKLTMDYSFLTLDDRLANQRVTGNRVRVQWDISF